MLGARSKRPQSGITVPRDLRSRSRLIGAVVESGERPELRLRRSTLRGCRGAEAGGSPSSEAPPDGSTVDGSRRAQARLCGLRRIGAIQKVAVPKGIVAGGQRSWESSSRRSARVERRLQKSVRRIFLAARRGVGQPSHEATRDEPSGAARWLEATHQPLTRRERARGEREGARVEPANVNNARDSICPVRKLRDDPMEGVLVRRCPFALTRRRARRIWCGEVLQMPFSRRCHARPSRGNPRDPRRRGSEPANLGDSARQRASEVVLVR